MAPLPGAAEVPVGAIVEIQAGRGVVRFNGTTRFATGRWIGVELSEPKGKNDGSVDGEAYFTCKPKHGMFIRATMIKAIELPTNLGASTSRSNTLMINRKFRWPYVSSANFSPVIYSVSGFVATRQPSEAEHIERRTQTSPHTPNAPQTLNHRRLITYYQQRSPNSNKCPAFSATTTGPATFTKVLSINVLQRPTAATSRACT
ncbi:hypothetical protein FRB90_004657 [Tulasnella sp. 427]|nr:hypothetical protein FRB90_004657 [Tulasnella sp. 427]